MKALKYKFYTLKFQSLQITSLYIKNIVIFKPSVFNQFRLFIPFYSLNRLQSWPVVIKPQYYCKIVNTLGPTARRNLLTGNTAKITC